MAVVFACSENSGWECASGEYGAFQTAGQRVSMLVNAFATVRFDAPLTEGRVSIWKRHGTWTNTGVELCLYDAEGVGIVRMVKTSTGAIRYDYWNGTTWITHLPSAGAPNSTNKYEFYFKTGPDGQFIYYYNNALISQHEIGDATRPATYMTLQPLGGTGTTSHRGAITEVLVTDNERNLLNVGFETEGPTSNGTDVDGTGSYLDVDEAGSDFGATVCQLPAAGNRRSFKGNARTLTHAGGSMLAVTVAAEMRYGDTGPRKARFYLLIGGVRYYGRTFDLTESLKGYHHAFNTNPATGLKWVKADAEAASLEWGVEAVA